MLHPFCADEPVCQFLDIPRLAAKYYYFQAILVVEMRMQGGNDDCVILVLKIGKLLRQQACVMIVDECDRADDKRIGRDYCRAHKPVTNQIAKCLRAVIVAFVRYERIKPLQQF